MRELRFYPGVLVAASLALACQQAPGGSAAQGTPSPTPTPAAGDEVRETTDKIAREAQKAGDKLAEGAKKIGEEVGPEAKRIGGKIAEGAQAAGTELSGAKQTLAVKAALLADKTVDSSKIDVDTDVTSNTVTLRGSVPSPEQKATAERIARKHSGGFAVKNNLKVVAPG